MGTASKKEATMSGEIRITVAGNLTADPETQNLNDGTMFTRFTIAQTSYQIKNGQRQETGTVFMRCVAWRETAQHIAASLTKGMRVIAMGRLKTSTYQDKNGVTRTGMELNVEDIGPSLRFATANVTRIQQQNGFNPNPSGGFSNPNQGVYGGPFAQPQTGWNQPAQTAPQFTAQPAQQAQPGFVDPWATPSPAQQPPVSDNNPTDEPEF